MENNKKINKSLKYNFVNKTDFEKKIHVDYAIICTPSKHFISEYFLKKKSTTLIEKPLYYL